MLGTEVLSWVAVEIIVVNGCELVLDVVTGRVAVVNEPVVDWVVLEEAGV